MTALEKAKIALPLPALMERLGVGDRAKRNARCPFPDHADANPSFGIFQDGHGDWSWKCHSRCGGGDEADFIARLETVSNAEGCRRFIALAGVQSDADSFRHTVSKTPARKPLSQQSSTRALLPVEIYNPSDEQCATAVRMAQCLAEDEELRTRIAERRSWNPETLRQLALEGYLGWNRGPDGGRLAFIYDSGVKLRWREKDERIIRWAFGKPWLWRGAWLGTAETVYLCESETDSIALIDGGLENEPGVVVVALPSASTFKEDWVHLFHDKDVILVFDNDDAGRKATQTVSKQLRGHARSVNRLNWEGVQHAS